VTSAKAPDLRELSPFLFASQRKGARHDAFCNGRRPERQRTAGIFTTDGLLLPKSAM